MALKVDDYNTDPSLNTDPAPVGAAEFGVKNKQVNDIMRYMMAAIREVYDDYKAVKDALKSMANQAANAVAITGGSIIGTTLSDTNNINAAALKAGVIPDARFPAGGVPSAQTLLGLSLQGLYNHIYPVGTIRFTTASTTSYPVPSAITATWGLIDDNRNVKIRRPSQYTGSTGTFEIGGVTTTQTELDGRHAHGGATQATTLTVAQIPKLKFTGLEGKRQEGQSLGYRGEGTTNNLGLQDTPEIGGGLGHTHGIDFSTEHRHDVVVDPPWLGVLAWKRLS